MTVLDQPSDLAAQGRPVCVAIGVFDGVHRGHQAVIQEMKREAGTSGGVGVVVTFDRHPNAIVAPERTPPLIQTLPQRLAAIADLGVEAAWVIRFDQEFSRLTGEQFVRQLARDFAPLRRVTIGEAFHFGYRRSGNVTLLHQFAGELGFSVHAVPPIRMHDEAVSSTRIRDAIRNGEFDLVETLLGRPYRLSGAVVRGDQLGQQLGFPTANLQVDGLVLPPRGVYVARARLAGQEHGAVVNIGVRPSVAADSSSVRIEAHLLDITGNWYGAELELTFSRRLRGEVRFDSLTDLQAQIRRDIAAARAVLGQPSKD